MRYFVDLVNLLLYLVTVQGSIGYDYLESLSLSLSEGPRLRQSRRDTLYSYTSLLITSRY